MYLSWVIPAYNEEKRIERTVREVADFLRSRQSRGVISGYEIIVANSASTDRTAEVVAKLSSEIPNLKLDSLVNRGKGWAVKQGMLAARGDIRLFSDADNSTPPESFDKAVPRLQEGWDVVISSRDPRDAAGASRDVEEPWYREVMGSLGNLLIQLVGVAGIWDTQNGFKVFKAKTAEDIFSRTLITGFAFDIELLAIARMSGYKIAIVPVKWFFAEDSKVTFKDYFQVLRDVFRIRWNIITGKYKKL